MQSNEQPETKVSREGVTGSADVEVVTHRLGAMKNKFSVRGGYKPCGGAEPLDVTSTPMPTCRGYKNVDCGHLCEAPLVSGMPQARLMGQVRLMIPPPPRRLASAAYGGFPGVRAHCAAPSPGDLQTTVQGGEYPL